MLERKHWRELLQQQFRESVAHKIPDARDAIWADGRLCRQGELPTGLTAEARYRVARLVRKRSRSLPGPRPLRHDAK